MPAARPIKMPGQHIQAVKLESAQVRWMTFPQQGLDHHVRARTLRCLYLLSEQLFPHFRAFDLYGRNCMSARWP